jgi:hypothetical protein
MIHQSVITRSFCVTLSGESSDSNVVSGQRIATAFRFGRHAWETRPYQPR